MTKHELDAAISALKTETHDALQLIVAELNHGQRQKIMKNPAVAELLQRYGVENAT